MLSAMSVVAAYVITALALYWMGRACGVKRPWLSWIPFASDYALGTLAECSANRGTNESKPYRRILLGLSIAQAALSLVAVATAVVLAFGLLRSLDMSLMQIIEDPDGFTHWLETLVEDEAALEAAEAALTANLPALLLLLGVGLALAGVSTGYLVYYFIALWHIFRLYDETHAKWYMLISVLGYFVVPDVGGVIAPLALLIVSRIKKPDFGENDDENDPEKSAPLVDS